MLTVGHVSLAAVPSLSALLELDELSFNEFGQSLQAGDLFDMVFIRPQYELNSSSLFDEAVVEDTKAKLSTRSESSILKDPLDHSNLWLRNFKTWCVIIHHRCYLPIEVFVMKLTWSWNKILRYTAVAFTKGAV